jgi:hypothetical protein
MKYLNVILALAFVVTFVNAAQKADLSIRDVRDPVTLRRILNENAADVTANRGAQADTNSTTAATLYTPAFTGQVLIGGAGTGTNAVWISKGTTTNDWVQVAP